MKYKPSCSPLEQRLITAEDRLFTVDMVRKTDGKPNGRYLSRLKVVKEVEAEKKAHREVFEEKGDITMKPVLDPIFL